MPKIPQRRHDIEAEVTLLSTEQGGRTRPAGSGYRPAHRVRHDALTTGVHEYVDQAQLSPGESTMARIWFIAPEAYPHALRAGQVLNVHEGGRVVGNARITRVLNPILDRPTAHSDCEEGSGPATFELPVFSTVEEADRDLRVWIRDHPEVPEHGTLQTLALGNGKTGYRYVFKIQGSTEVDRGG